MFIFIKTKDPDNHYEKEEYYHFLDDQITLDDYCHACTRMARSVFEGNITIGVIEDEEGE